MPKKKRGWKKHFAIFVLFAFIGSTLGFALFSKPINKQVNNKRQFLYQNIFDTPISEEIQRDVLFPGDPNSYPKVPIERKIGGIWIEYSCHNCTSLVSNLTRIVKKYFPRVYLSPDYNLDTLISLMSWNDQQNLKEFNETKIEDFICLNLWLPPDICALRGL